jgi:cytochrome c oxidase subunit 2
MISIGRSCWVRFRRLRPLQTKVPGDDGTVRRASQDKRPPLRRSLPAVVAASVLVAGCSGEGPQSALDPRSDLARDIDGLWDLVFVLATIVCVIVLAGMVYSIIRFRERKGDDREPKQLHGNTPLEITWTIIPAVILAIISVPTVQGIFDIRAEPDAASRIDVDVVGHQWWWEFTYPGFVDADGRPLTTANELHIPVEETVYLTMTSVDVIHSFWVPPLNGKRDVVPGRESNVILTADAEVATTDYGFGTGVVLGQCAEFCGLAHADMRVRVFVHSRAEFDAWVEQQLEPAPVPAEDSGALATGYQTFELVCTACHMATVEGPEGVEVLGQGREVTGGDRTFATALAPNLTHFGSRTTFGGGSFDNVSDHLARWLANPSDLKPMSPERNDVAEGRILGMPNFGLSQQEIDGLVALLESWK